MRYLPITCIFILDLIYLIGGVESRHASDGKNGRTAAKPMIQRNLEIVLHSESSDSPDQKTFARITFYYPGSDSFGWKSSTGTKLRPWITAAVDPDKIPYGSKIEIDGLGNFIAHDTGSAVVNRKAARLSGKTKEQKNALVIDICVRDEQEMDRISRSFPLFAEVKINKL